MDSSGPMKGGRLTWCDVACLLRGVTLAAWLGGYGGCLGAFRPGRNGYAQRNGLGTLSCFPPATKPSSWRP